MPIDIERFETGESLDAPPTSERILRFLRRNPDRAYTRSDIATAIDADPETVGTNLTRLKERGLVRHRSPYWALAPDTGSVDDAQAEKTTDHPERPRNVKTTTGTDGPEGAHGRAADAFVEAVENELDERIEAVYVFGSVARGAETEQSDVDVLAVVADDADFGAVDDRLLDIAYDVQLDHGVVVEVHTLRGEEFRERRDRGEPFARTVVEEGVRRV
ncbi:MarR family protein [Halomicrobium zhouii]|uniref:MarR family protein n=1 Tax=Halomicrobium zhouii TaxID=767519 RepID=A0A1I6KQ58_9EURY|nr:nucleotidyltransferase domain-containing protein [Halomicrobium zhouii]SFR93392.1 MarR family protein [Halomicrobium zhouii]